MRVPSGTDRSPLLVRYGIGLSVPLVAGGLTYLLWGWLQPAVSLLFFPAVMIAALYGGLGAGLVATVLSVALSAFFYVPPVYSFSIGLDDLFRLMVFSIGAVITASLVSARERVEMRLRRTNHDLQRALDDLTTLTRELEGRVVERTSDLEASNHALRVEAAERERLSEQLVRAQESERRRLARELHDQVGQMLTGLKLSLEASARTPARAVFDGETALDLVEALLAQIREISLDLRPSMLDDLGLAPALLWHFDRYTRQTGIAVHFIQSGLSRRFAGDIETAVFRIVQEALTNVARHAGVKEASVWVRADAAELGVIVEDGGRGFGPEAIPAGSSSGVSGMRERVSLLRGTFAIQSAPSGGTRVTAILPLAGLVEESA